MLDGGAFLSGLGTGLSLILAIGAQNAFVLKQGLLRHHVFAVCAFCALSDALLIAAGVAGAGAIAERAPWFLSAMRWGGAAFLIWYGARSLRAAIIPAVTAPVCLVAAFTALYAFGFSINLLTLLAMPTHRLLPMLLMARARRMLVTPPRSRA